MRRALLLLLLLIACCLPRGWGQCNITTCGNQTIAPGRAVQLWAEGADSYIWTPSIGLSATDIANPIASPSTTTTYTVTAYGNIIINGDFEQGNTGFSSDYSYKSGTNSQIYSGQYCVDKDAGPHNGNSFWIGNGHEPGNTSNNNSSSQSKFMIVNGSGDPNDVVWQTTVAVNPNTQYTFSAWARTIRNKTNLSNNQRANLRFKINGVQIGSDFMCPKTHSYWAHFEQVWNSGNATSATIQIYDVNTNAESGNDFGLDDIELKSGNDLCGSEELTVLVMDPIMAPPAICAGGSLVLTEPTVYGASGYGRWEVSPTLNGTYFPLGNSGVPVSYNGYYLRYAFNYNGDWYFSNVVTLAVDAPVVVNIQAESTELCEGESVTINATVNTQEYYHVGDILCTDGTIVKASNWPCGKTAKGVVFYVDPSGRHGWAVSKVSQNDNIRWGSSQFSQHDTSPVFDVWKANLPSESVRHPSIVPTINTFAPTSRSFPSVTTPVTVV